MCQQFLLRKFAMGKSQIIASALLMITNIIIDIKTITLDEQGMREDAQVEANGAVGKWWFVFISA